MKTHWPTLIGVAIMLTLLMVLAEQGRPTEMGVMICASAVAFAFLNLDRLKSFKGAGFEAEMREAVDEAHATVAQLRLMATSIAESNLTSLMAGNFFDGMTLAARIDLHDKLVKSLQEIGVSEPEIEAAKARWSKGVCVIYHRGIRHLVGQQKAPSTINFAAAPAARAAAEEFQEMLQFEDWSAPSAQQMRAFIDGKGLMTDAIDELLEDYASFEVTGALRHRERFVCL